MTFPLWSAGAAAVAAAVNWAAAVLSLVYVRTIFKWPYFVAFTTISLLGWLYVVAYGMLEFSGVEQGDWSATMIQVSPVAFLIGWTLIPILWLLERVRS